MLRARAALAADARSGISSLASRACAAGRSGAVAACALAGAKEVATTAPARAMRAITVVRNVTDFGRAVLIKDMANPPCRARVACSASTHGTCPAGGQRRADVTRVQGVEITSGNHHARWVMSCA